MASYDEEIRVAIIATAEGVQAGTDEAAAAVEGMQARIEAAQSAAASAYTESQRAWAAAQAEVAQVVAQGQQASVAAITAAYDQLNAARDASLANARAYLAEISAEQQSALGVEDYGTQAAAAALAEQVIAERAAAETAYEDAAAQLEEAGAIDAAVASTEADTAAQAEDTAAKVGNTGATIGLTEAVAGLARGNAGMAAYGIARMGIASRLLTALMTPAGLAIAGMTGAVIAWGAAAVEGSIESERLNNALLATNDAAGQTLGQLQAMAGELASGDTTIGEAKDAILALAQSGKLEGESFRQAAQATVDFANLTGQTTQQAAKYVEALATATTQSLIKANEQYHFLTFDQFRHIALLRQEGKEAQATQAIMDAFYNAMSTREKVAVQQEGYLARGWNDIKSAISGAIDALEQWGATQGPEQKIAALKEQLAALKARDPYDSTGVEAHIESEIAALQRLEAQQHKVAGAHAAANTTTDNKIASAYGTGVAHPHAAASGYTYVPRAESASGASAEIAQDGRVLEALQRDADRRVQIAQQVNSINEGAARNHAQAMLQIHLDQLRTEEAQGKISHSQELADERQLYAQEYAAQLASYQRQLALEKDKPVEVARINAEIERLQDAHLQRMTAAQETAAQRQAQAFQRALQPITSAFTTSINGIIMGTQTMQMAVGRILDSILLKYLDVAIKSSVQWVASEAEKTAATQIGTVERVALVEVAEMKTLAIKMLSAAKYFAIAGAEAAVGAFKAMVGIPYVGPVLAVAAAAAAAAEVKNLAHFDVGAWNIPHDMPAMVHAGETILPRPFAEDFRRNGGSLGATPGGDVHVHLHGQSAGGLFTAHMDDLVNAFKIAHRTGALAEA